METLSHFNWEIHLFLKNLTAHKNNASKVNTATLKLLEDVLEKVGEFMEYAEIDSSDNGTSQIFQIDETHFELQRLIICKLCHLPIGATQGEYVAHVVSEHHNLMFAQYINAYGTGKPRNNESVATPIMTNTFQNVNRTAQPLNKKPVSTSSPRNGQNSSRSRAVGVSDNASVRDRNYNRTPSNESRQSTQSQYNNNDRRNSFGGRNRDYSDVGGRHWRNSNENLTRGNWQNDRQYSSQHNLNSYGPKPNNNNRNDRDAQRNDNRNASSKEEKQAGPPPSVPNVFDDDIYSFIDNPSPKESKSDQRDPPAPANKAPAPPPNDLPPYMLNSLFTSRLGQGRDDRLKKPQTKNVAAPPARKTSIPDNQDVHVKSVVPKNTPTNAGGPIMKPLQVQNGAEIKPVPSYMLEMLQKKNSRKPMPTVLIGSPSSKPSAPNVQPATGDSDAQKGKIIALLQTLRGSQSAASTNGTEKAQVGPLADDAIPQRSRSRTSSADDVSAGLNDQLPNTVATQSPGRKESLNTTELLKEFFLRDISLVISFQVEETLRLRDLTVYKEIATSIEDLMRDTYPGVKCHMMGSRMVGLATEQSLVDIFIDLLSSFNTSRSATALKDASGKTENALKSNEYWSGVKFIDRDGNPMIRLFGIHNPSELHCNITFGIHGTGVAVHTSNLIKGLFDIQKVCHQTTVCIIRWFRELPSKQMEVFNRYLITLLVIFYFQNKGKLPSVAELQKNTNVKCGDNYVGFQLPKAYPIWSERFRNILIGFFEFYSSYNFKENIISVFEGASLGKNIGDQDEEALTAAANRFKSFVLEKPQNWTPESMLAVQDVFVHRNNVGQSVHSADLCRFQAYCQESLDILTSAEADSLRY